MKKVLLVATVQSHIAQFHKPLIEMLHENGCEVHVAAKNNLAQKHHLTLSEPDAVFDIPFDRSPFSAKNLKAYKELKALLKKEHYDIVHCNTPVAGILTRKACHSLKKKDRPYVIYEAHGFHFYKGAPKKNWLLWYPVEKHYAKLADTLITITSEDFALASHKFKTNVVRVHGVGINTKKYVEFASEQKASYKESLHLPLDRKIVLCTGELNENKNQSLLIHALPKVVERYPDVQVLFAGNGPLEGDLKSLVDDLGVSSHVTFLGYRSDLEIFLNLADLVVSCSKREGLPMNIGEAMWLSKPVVVSSNRGHRELIKDGVDGYIVTPLTSDLLADRILFVLSNEEEAKKIGTQAKKDSEPYLDENVKKELYQVYFGRD